MNTIKNENKLTKCNIEYYKKQIKDKYNINEDIDNIYYLHDMFSIWLEDQDDLQEINEKHFFFIKEIEFDDEIFNVIYFLYDHDDIKTENIINWILKKTNDIINYLKYENEYLEDGYKFYCFFKKSNWTRNKKRYTSFNKWEYWK